MLTGCAQNYLTNEQVASHTQFCLEEDLYPHYRINHLVGKIIAVECRKNNTPSPK